MKEPSYDILASSLDNYIVLDNVDTQMKPTVSFIVKNHSSNVTLTIEDENNSDGTKFVLVGSADNANDFNTSTSKESTLYSLVAALERYPIFYNIRIESNYTITANIDSQIKYRITSSNPNMVGIGGTYSSYKVGNIPRFRVEVNTEGDVFTLEKKTIERNVSFNITSPFKFSTTRYPININLHAYVLGDVNKRINFSNSSLTILPTTLPKFSDIDYSQYCYTTNRRDYVDFLTTKKVKSYSYGERCALSLLTKVQNITLLKKYYTNGGVFLAQSEGCLKSEYNNNRLDFYFDLALDDVEMNNNKQVGYVEVVAVHANTLREISNAVRYEIKPTCEEGTTLYFINAIGGVESFTFYGERIETSKIKNKTTSYNLSNNDENEYKYQFVHTKKTERVVKLTTNKIDRETADFLLELQASKYVWLHTDSFKVFDIIVDKFDIELTNRQGQFVLSLEYYKTDDSVNY